ncbi:heme transporter hrg-1-like [Argiope bruennichi]|uniref:Uncharacterized protein n=1 Tax=Argiope bruennichi TaxID=94029 RepID=A0A8T0FLV2_ARGBR|nr:heme transporter hrg-1-like [Argiope bruennichi]XP_055930416.1 heme transporter hrg-1-like [Argiope bruennichi]KAF8790380.1 hypothetical protein HNY73_005406 [Argiope bruennichi]
MEGPQRCLGLKQVFAILGILSGASIFVSFAALKNVNAALWGLLSGIFAAIVLNLHINYRRRVLHLKYTPESLRIVKLCGLVLSIVTLTASIVYFILMAVYHQGYKLEGNGYAPAAIFALLALKWTVMMFFEGRKYQRFLVASATEGTPIVNGGPTSPPPPYEAIKP